MTSHFRDFPGCQTFFFRHPAPPPHPTPCPEVRSRHPLDGGHALNWGYSEFFFNYLINAVDDLTYGQQPIDEDLTLRSEETRWP